MNFADHVRKELYQAEKEHGSGFNSPHEAYAVIKEELDEFWDEVKTKKQLKQLMVRELVQVAAMAQKAAESIMQATAW